MNRENATGRRIFAWATIGLALFQVTLVALGEGSTYSRGEITYKIWCSRCHGVDGKGDGLDKKALKTLPTNFTDCGKMNEVSDAVIFEAIKNGGSSVGMSSEMPAWGKGISDEDIRGVMTYLRRFCPRK